MEAKAGELLTRSFGIWRADDLGCWIQERRIVFVAFHGRLTSACVVGLATLQGLWASFKSSKTRLQNRSSQPES